ncbi:MAG: hypothetical protein KY460_03620 [Actinobacteria bacterium]|nr:hypothetical protein [Actinomycetota bacterium]
MAPTSPAIEQHGWGRITVAGRTYKDVVLWPGGATAWDWTRTGTSHGAGVQPADVRAVLDRGAGHVILSLGRQRRLTVHAETMALLDAEGVAYDVLPTDDAIVRYAQLRDDGVAVGALIHTTC